MEQLAREVYLKAKLFLYKNALKYRSDQLDL